MTSPRFLSFVGLLVLMSLSRIPPAAGQEGFTDLVGRLPYGANAIMLINVEKVHKSPVAQKEDWKEKQEAAFEAGMHYLPPSAKRFVMAAQLDFANLRPIWQSAMFEIPNAPSMEEVAKRRQGVLDQVGDRQAVVLRSGAYLVGMGGDIYGAVVPANRQNVARWLRDAASPSVDRLSPYLKEAFQYSEFSGTEIILALDLQDVVTPQLVQAGLAQAESIAGKPIDLQKATDTLASLKGLMLGITLGERTFGKIKVDFGKSTAPIAAVAKPLLLEALANHGSMIDDFKEWEAKVDGNHVFLQGNLSGPGLRNILSLMEPPTSAPTAQKEVNEASTPGEPASPGEAGIVALASRQHFRSVTSLVNEMKAKKRDAKTLGQYGNWFDKYAQKINNLPILNVDKELVAYSANVAEEFRNVATVIKGVPIQADVAGRQASQAAANTNASANYYGGAGANPYFGVGYGAGVWAQPNYMQWYFFDPYENLRQQDAARRNVKAQLKAQGFNQAREILQRVDNETAEVRRKMTDRYMVEF